MPVIVLGCIRLPIGVRNLSSERRAPSVPHSLWHQHHVYRFIILHASAHWKRERVSERERLWVSTKTHIRYVCKLTGSLRSDIPSPGLLSFSNRLRDVEFVEAEWESWPTEGDIRHCVPWHCLDNLDKHFYCSLWGLNCSLSNSLLRVIWIWMVVIPECFGIQT